MAFATSSAVPGRPSGALRRLASAASQSEYGMAVASSAWRRCWRGVSMRPTPTPLTRTLDGASSAASARMALVSAARPTPIAPSVGSGSNPGGAVRPTIVPHEARRCSTAGRTTFRNAASLSVTSVVMSVRSSSSRLPCRPCPARAATPSSRSPCSTASATTRAAPSVSVTSASTAWSHGEASSASADRSRPRSRPQIVTVAPSSRRRRAVASPIPDEPPVTMKLRPASARSICQACQHQVERNGFFPIAPSLFPRRGRVLRHRARRHRGGMTSEPSSPKATPGEAIGATVRSRPEQPPSRDRQFLREPHTRLRRGHLRTLPPPDSRDHLVIIDRSRRLEIHDRSSRRCRALTPRRTRQDEDL